MACMNCNLTGRRKTFLGEIRCDCMIPKEYIVYLELFGKKMKVGIMANSESEVKEIIKSRIKFHKVEKSDNSKMFDDIFKDIFK